MDDETNKPETDVDISSASSHEGETEKLTQNDQPSEDTVESTEIQGKEIQADDDTNTPIASKRTEFDRFHEQFDSVEVHTVGEALDYRTNKIRERMKFKEELTIAFSQNGNIHQSYNASWREEVRLLFRLQAGLRRRKKSLSQDELNKAVTNPGDYAFGPHEIKQMFDDNQLPANGRQIDSAHDQTKAPKTEEANADESAATAEMAQVHESKGVVTDYPQTPQKAADEDQRQPSAADLDTKENKEAS